VLRGGTHIGAGGLSEGPGNMIALYGVHLLGLPKMECPLTGATGGEFGILSWSPDERSLAWAEGNGIWTGAIGHDCSGSPHLTIAGAREPDWGPAGAGATPSGGIAVQRSSCRPAQANVRAAAPGGTIPAIGRTA
jgi:hypothetical protein